MKILLQQGLINYNQYGFVPDSSTQLAVLETVCDLNHAMNSNLITGLLFLDVRIVCCIKVVYYGMIFMNHITTHVRSVLKMGI